MAFFENFYPGNPPEVAGLCSIQPPLVDDPNATDLGSHSRRGTAAFPPFLILGVVNAPGTQAVLT